MTTPVKEINDLQEMRARLEEFKANSLAEEERVDRLGVALRDELGIVSLSISIERDDQLIRVFSKGQSWVPGRASRFKLSMGHNLGPPGATFFNPSRYDKVSRQGDPGSEAVEVMVFSSRRVTR